MRIDNIRNLQTSSYRRCLRVTLFLFVIQLFAVSPLWAGNDDKIVVPKLKINPGTTQQLVIQLTNEEEYTAFQAEIYFPDGISPVKTDDGYCVSLSSRKTNHTISANIVSDGGLKVAAYSMNNESLKGNSGDLFYIDIVSESTFEGPKTIEVKEILFTKTSDRKEIEFADASGIVDNHMVILGDANGDGQVNVTDIVATVNKIMDKPSADFNFEAADVNMDGFVNVTDIVGMVNIIMKGSGAREMMEVLEEDFDD